VFLGVGSLALCLLDVIILAACPKEEIKKITILPICFRKFVKSKFCIFAACALSILFCMPLSCAIDRLSLLT
jgi:hypothetical protein